MSFAAPPRRAGVLERPDCRIAFEVIPRLGDQFG
jgi:hypothetical protein